MKIGVNAGGGMTYYGPIIYADLMKQCGPLTAPGYFNPARLAPPLGPDGYPLYVNPAGTPYGLAGGILAKGESLPAGSYILAAEGKGEIKVDVPGLGTTRVTIALPGGATSATIPVAVPKVAKNPNGTDVQGGFTVSLSDVADPVRNVSIKVPGWGDQLFRAEYLLDVAGFKILRFMDFMGVNNSPLVSWPEYLAREAMASNGFRGTAPYADCCTLANLTDAAPWFCIPHKADDDFIAEMAAKIDANLDPLLPIYIEYSNELWNFSFQQTSWVYGQSVSSGEHFWRLQGRLSAIAVNKFADALPPGRRCIRVVSGQAVNPGEAKNIVIGANQGGGADVLSCAPYFPYFVNAAQKNAAFATFKAIQARIAGGEASAIGEFLDFAGDNAVVTAQNMTKWRTLADANGMDLVLYECGQHYLDPAADLTALFIAANRHPGFGDVCDRYLDALRDAGVDGLCWYGLVSTATKAGAWGLNESVGQPIETAPKMAAVKSWIAANPDDSPEPEPQPGSNAVFLRIDGAVSKILSQSSGSITVLTGHGARFVHPTLGPPSPTNPLLLQAGPDGDGLRATGYYTCTGRTGDVLTVVTRSGSAANGVTIAAGVEAMLLESPPTTISGLLGDGTNTIVTGDGTAETPYRVAADVAGLPDGGTTGQYLVKASNDDGDAAWAAPPDPLPDGGATGQVLSKASNADGDYAWATPGGGGGSGTVTEFTFLPANGFSGSVSTATTTPQLTVSTPVTGMLKGSGGAMVAATAGTDYLTGNQSISLTGAVTGNGATSIATTLADNTVSTSKVASNAVTYAKIQAAASAGVIGASAAGNYGHVTLSGLEIAAGALGISDNAVTTAKINAAAVTTTKIAESNVTTAKIADANVTDVKLADNAVVTAKINALAVTDVKLAANSVTTAKILDANVTTAKLADANVTDVKLASNAVTTAKILDANVTKAKIDAAARTEVKLGPWGTPVGSAGATGDAERADAPLVACTLYKVLMWAETNPGGAGGGVTIQLKVGVSSILTSSLSLAAGSLGPVSTTSFTSASVAADALVRPTISAIGGDVRGVTIRVLAREA